MIQAQDQHEGKLEALILHSFSWHEVTIVFFSNSYRLIANKILQIRELTFGDIQPEESASAFQNHQKVMEKSLLYHFRKEETGKTPTKAEIDQSHIIVHTHTTFGYDVDMLLEEANNQIELLDEDEINFYIRWNIKPGHLYSFVQDLEKELKRHAPDLAESRLLNGKITAGRGDYSYIISKNALKEYREIVNMVIQSRLIKHVRKIKHHSGVGA